MEIKEYLRILRRYWLMIVLFVAVGAGVGYATLWVSYTARQYQSTATLFVATQQGYSVTEAYQNNLFSQQRVFSYADLAKSDLVASRAADQLKAQITPDALSAKVSASVPENTVLLHVSVRDPDPAQAQVYTGAIADQLVQLVAEVETSRRGGAPAAGAVVVDEANYPTQPMGFGMWARIGLGAAGGLVIGIAIAVLAGIADRRLRGREPVEEVMGSLVLGALPNDPVRHKADVVDLAGKGLYAERVREMRTNLRFATLPGGGGPPHVIAVTSPAPEEGRTTVAIDLATALAESGRTVVLVDGDLRHPALAQRLPLSDASRASADAHGLSTVLTGEHDVAEALLRDISVGEHSVHLLPAGPQAPRPGELWARDRALSLFSELGRHFDYVVVDTPPLGTYNDGAIVGALCDGAVVVVRIRSTTSSALRRALQTLQTAGVRLIGTVVTFEPVSPLTRRGHRKRVERDLTATGTGRSQTDSGEGAEDGAAEGNTQGLPVGRAQLAHTGNARRSGGTRRGST